MVSINMTEEDFSELNYFDMGVHKVTIVGAMLEKMDDGREYVEVGVKGEDGESDSVRMWLHTEAAAKFTMRVLQGICTHNAKTEAEKDKVRAGFIGSIDDKKLANILGVMDGYEAWLLVEEDPVRTYEKEGRQYKSINKNIYGYEPKPRKQTREELVEELMGASEPVEQDEVPFP